MNKKETELVLQLAKLAKRHHYYCEDYWYSCPKAEGGCANEKSGNDCDCGADEHNLKVDDIILNLSIKEQNAKN